jgi:F-type H+-transporting ATPase subunit delta
MDSNRVTVRYAKALIELASEQNVLDNVSRDINVLYSALDQFDGFAEYIANPGSSVEKLAQMKTIFASDFHALTMKFIQLVFDNKREEYLKDLCRNIIAMSREIKGIVSATLITAQTIDKELIRKVKTKFEEKIKATIELQGETNPNLIGGFVFTIDGQQYDASVASKLHSIKKQLQIK